MVPSDVALQADPGSPETGARSTTMLSAARAGAVAAFVVLLALVAFALRPTTAAAQAPEVQVSTYDLGVTRFAEPGQTGRFARIPIRLWGVVGVPAGAGPAPVVVIAHGRHGDNCPGEYAEWPCFSVEQRNDLGMTYLVRALARAGVVAIAPDVNAAYTGGFAELTADAEHRRFNEIVDASLAALTAASAGSPTRFTLPLQGRVDPTRVGILGHSRGGLNALDWAGKNTALVKSVVLVAPFFDPSETVPDVPTTLILGTCDRDTGTSGAGYLSAARTSTRTAPSWRLVVRGANHNSYNATLVRLRMDDASEAKGRCARAQRPRATGLQAFLGRVAGNQFANTLLGAPAAPWQLAGATSGRIYGQTVTLSGAHRLG